MNLNPFTFFTGETSTELESLYPLSVGEKDFISNDMVNIFSRILTDTLERTDGLAEKYLVNLFDNCLNDKSNEGLISLLAGAMTNKKDLFLVYEPAVKVLRLATEKESEQIRKDYKEKSESPIGTFISFAKYTRSDMLRIYTMLEYCTVDSLNKSMNLSKAIQIKMNEMRASVGVNDKADAIAQAVTIAAGLRDGKAVMLDGKDIIETAKPDLTATKASIDFIAEKKSFYLGLPASYLAGDTYAKSLGDTGKGDAKKVEQGLKNYFFSIIQPVLKSLFNATVTFKSDDLEQIKSSMEILKTMDLTSQQYLSEKNKQLIVNKAFGLPSTETGDPIETVPVDPNAPVDPKAKPPIPGQKPPPGKV